MQIHSKCVCDLIETHIHLLHTGEYSQRSSILWPFWLNSSVFVYKLRDFLFESCFSHLTSMYDTCFEKEFLDIQAIIESRFTVNLQVTL